MPFKDRDRQRAYQRDWVRRRRLQGATNKQADVEPTVEPIDSVTLLGLAKPPELAPRPFAVPLTKERQVKGFNKR